MLVLQVRLLCLVFSEFSTSLMDANDIELSLGMDFEKVQGLWKHGDEAVIISFRKSKEHVYEISGYMIN